MVKKVFSPTTRPPLGRMLHLHEKLSRGAYPNCRREAAELEVSSKTIMRDLEFMRDRLGLPIAYDPVRYGFHYTEKVSSFPTVQVTEGELMALYVARQALAQYQGTGLEEPLQQAFRKLTEGLRDTVDFQAGEEGGILSFRQVGTPVADLDLFQKLGRAVLHRQEIRFRYRKLGGAGEEVRRVHPYHLSCIDNQWYLFAHDLDRKKLRTFVLPRMKRLEITDQTFTRPAGFSPGRLLKQSFGVHSPTGTYEVVVRFRDQAAVLVREKIWHPTQRLTTLADGRTELAMTVGNLIEVERWVLGWGAQAEVISPRELAASIETTARAMTQLYRSGGKARSTRKQAMPAARAAASPVGESSKTRQRRGSTPKRSAPRRKGSG
jgi:proteasome accessory factor B